MDRSSPVSTTVSSVWRRAIRAPCIYPFVDAYGEHHDDGVMEVPRNEFPDDMELETGSRVQGQQSDGAVVSFTIMSVTDATVTLDANHPLAGKNLTFDLMLVSIEE